MQRHTSLAIPFGTSDFNTIQTAGRHDFDALSTQTHCVLHGAFHCAAEHNTLFKLLGNRIRNQLCINFRFANLFDIDSHRNTQFFCQIFFEFFDIFAFFTDNNTRTS